MRAIRRNAAAIGASLAICAVALPGCGGGANGDDRTSVPATTAASDGANGGNAEAGAAVWEQANCGGCHTLEAAGSTGEVGPNLDDLKPDVKTVVTQVTNGGGGMPAFDGRLTPQQIDDVAAYVVRSTGG